MEQNIIPEGYKQTDIGVIPDDWSVDSFDRICNVNQGLQIPIEQRKKNPSVHSKVYITIKSIGSNDAPEYIDEYSKSVCCDSDDVLMTRTGNTGIVVTGVNGVFHNNFFKINFNRNEINAKYFVYYLRSRDCQKSILDKAGTSTIPDLNHGDFYSIQMAYPVFKEQTAIANALSDVDALIPSIEKLIAKKQAIKTATMQQLLTGNKRLPPFDIYQETDLAVIQGDKKIGQSKGTQQTELGEIPEDWGVETISSISAVPMQNGLFYEPSRKGQGISLINVGDMYKSAPIDVEQLELFNANIAEIKTFRVSSGDLFFTRSSIVPSGIAFCNIYESENVVRDVVFDSHLIRVRANAKMADAKYVYLACLSNLARKFLISSAKTATMTTIDQGAIKNCPIILPSLGEQKLIINILSDMDFELGSIKSRLAKTQQIKQGMMQELLTGKTRLL